MDQYVFESLREYLKNTSGPMIFYNTDGLELACLALLFSALFFLPGEQTTIIYNVYQSELMK